MVLREFRRVRGQHLEGRGEVISTNVGEVFIQGAQAGGGQG